MYAFSPIAFASLADPRPGVQEPGGGSGTVGHPTGTNSSPSVKKIVEIIKVLLPIFRGAGIVLLAWSAFSLIMAVKDENVESKVHATSQLAVAIVLITFSTLLSTLASYVGVFLD